jgi:hypothetical protein
MEFAPVVVAHGRRTPKVILALERLVLASLPVTRLTPPLDGRTIFADHLR